MITKEVMVLCHSTEQSLGVGDWKLESGQSEAGVKTSRRAAGLYTEFLCDCDTFVTSPVVLAQQCLFTIMRATGLFSSADICRMVNFCNELWTPRPERYILTKCDGSVSDWVKKDMAFAMDEGERVFCEIALVILPLMDCAIATHREGALCISHPGLVDLLFAHARKLLGDKQSFENMPDFGPCEGVKLTFENNRLSKAEELRMQLPYG